MSKGAPKKPSFGPCNERHGGGISSYKVYNDPNSTGGWTFNPSTTADGTVNSTTTWTGTVTYTMA